MVLDRNLLRRLEMANMSYCRFENTTHALRDCVYAMENLMEGTDAQLSVGEQMKAIELADLAMRYLELFVDELGEDSIEVLRTRGGAVDGDMIAKAIKQALDRAK